MKLSQADIFLTHLFFIEQDKNDIPAAFALTATMREIYELFGNYDIPGE